MSLKIMPEKRETKEAKIPITQKLALAPCLASASGTLILGLVHHLVHLSTHGEHLLLAALLKFTVDEQFIKYVVGLSVRGIVVCEF